VREDLLDDELLQDRSDDLQLAAKLSAMSDGTWPAGITHTLQVNAEAKGRYVPQAAAAGHSIETDAVVGQRAPSALKAARDSRLCAPFPRFPGPAGFQ